MFKKRHKKGASGAVMVEFALAFPILLITFIFAIQLLFVFIYDILGSYAAYAAARSYSVFCPQIGEVEAGKLAKGVAAAVMSSWTISGPGEPLQDYAAEEPPDGVREFLAMMSVVGLCGEEGNSLFDLPNLSSGNVKIGTDGLSRYQTALGRMKDFSVANETSGIYLKEGFYYAGKKTVERPMRGFFGGLIELAKSGLETLGSFGRWIAGLFPDGPKRYEAQMGHVSFYYDYSASMIFSQFSYLGSKAASSDKPTAFSIYQTCAMPIEPEWKTEPGKSKAAKDGFYAANYEQLMLDVNEKITNKLNAVYNFTKKKMGMVGATDYVQSFREFITGPRTDDRSDRNRSKVETWDIVEKLSGKQDGKYVDWQAVSASQSEITSPLLIEKDMSTQPNADKLSADERHVIDVLETIKVEISYRNKVIGNIDKEISQLDSDFGKVTSKKNRLDYLEGIKNGGWSSVSRYRIPPATKGGSPTPNWGAINADIASAEGIKIDSVYSELKGQGDSMNMVNRRAQYNDATNWVTARKIIWGLRKNCENGLITTNGLIKTQFVSLMNEAIIPIADYYRIQDQMIKDQELSLNEAKQTSDALKTTEDEK